MTRLQRELSGELGEFWKKDAEKRIEKVRHEYADGIITIDDNGVVRNRIGRACSDELVELVQMVTYKADADATKVAREEEAAASLERYRNRNRNPSAEEMFEMRAAFGEGTTVVDVVTGKTIKL